MKVLPNVLDEKTVKLLINLEKEQSVEWKQLAAKITDDQWIQYIKLKTAIQRKENKKIKEGWTFEKWCSYELYINNLSASRFIVKPLEKRIEEKRSKRNISENKEKFTFFDENDIFSLTYPCTFSAPPYNKPSYSNDNGFVEQLYNNGFQKTYNFSSVYQYYCFKKAMLFLNLDIAQKIVETKNIATLKSLIKNLENVNSQTWEIVRSSIMYSGNQLKFNSNPVLEKALYETQGTTLVQTGFNNKLWGINMIKKDPRALERSNWKGENLLGEFLTELRIQLVGFY